MHPRQRIREAAKAALVGRTAAGDRVYETRVLPWRKTELPAISIYTPSETTDDEVRSAPVEQDRRLDLVIAAVVEKGANVDDAMDAICWEIERAIFADETLGGTASHVQGPTTDTDVDEQGGRLVGVAQLTFSVRYFTCLPDLADVQADDLKSASVRYNLGGEQAPDDEARDELDISEG